MESQGKGAETGPRETSKEKSPESLFLDYLLEKVSPVMNVDVGTAILGTVTSAIHDYIHQPNRPPIACTEGCNHCCRYMVAVSSAEAIAIYRAIITSWPLSTIEDLKNKIANRVLLTTGMNEKEYWDTTHDVGCIFLNENGGCKIYPIRPRACSSLLVADVNPCRERSGMISQHSIPKNMGVIGYIALSKELKKRGLQSGIYEFNSALHTLFQDSTAAERWTRGEEVFTGNMNPKLDEHIHLEVS